MNKENFTFTADRYGYMIAYKGKNIGGASVMGKPAMHWKHARQNCKDNCESAKREIESLCNGYGSKHMIDAIAEINLGIN